MTSRKSVRFDDLIRHSDNEISYLWADDDANESWSAGESTETQRWSLTEGLPPPLPMRRNSPLTSGDNGASDERRRQTSPPNDPPDADNGDNDDVDDVDSTSLTPPLDNSSYIAIKGSLEGDMAKIGIRDIRKSARLPLHDDDTEDTESMGMKAVRTTSKQESMRSMMTDLAGTDHWSPLTDDFNDFTPPSLPMRRDSGDGLGSGLKTEHTLSTLPDDEDEDDLSLSMDYHVPSPPPPRFDK